MNEYAIGQLAAQERAFGVYFSPEEVPTFGINAFDTAEWSGNCIDTLIPDLKRRIAKRKDMKLNWMQSYFMSVLPVIQSIILEKGHVCVADIGGGQGENFISLESFFGSRLLEWHVIEQEKNCKYGEKLYLSDNIYFHENSSSDSGCLKKEVLDVLRQADICLLIGVLQYFPSYSRLLKEIAASGVEYIFVTRTFITKNTNTFYTRYYVAPGTGKYKDVILADVTTAAINYDEFFQYMQSFGYCCCLDIYQEGAFAELRSLPEPYNKCEYRDMIFRSNSC